MGIKPDKSIVQAKALIWAACTALVSLGVVEGLGVNWGSMASHPLDPKIVVKMLKDNGITKVKLFEADAWTANNLAGTGIEVMLGIPNDQLERFSSDYGEAKAWVKENVTKHIHDKGGVNIKYVAVGNEPFLKNYNDDYIYTTLPAIKNIQKALNEAGLGKKIKATCPHNADVYNSPAAHPVPSAGNFRSDIRSLMIQMVRYLHSSGAPFLVNIYPFLSLYGNENFPVDFAFFDGAGNTIEDNGAQYTTMFDANYDTLVWSLKKAGVPNMKIIISEVGWPTEGHPYATASMAHKFYRGFLKKLRENKGTPMRPGSMEVYLFGLLDEDQKSIEPGPFERHWGIFKYDGKPKFPIDLSGQGRNQYPVGAKGVQYLDSQWCVFNQKVGDSTLLPGNVNFACAYGDCTALTNGSSCSYLDHFGQASYAFNMYFQMQDQDVRACKFQGMAMITTVDPSVGNCSFPIQIVSAGHRPEFASLLATLSVTLTVVVVLVFL